jgi:hypothetical protein
MRTYMKQYYKNNPEKYKKHLEYVKKWARTHPEKIRESVRKWKSNNPEKVKARDIAHKIPLESKCSKCGCIDKSLDRHHPDYTKPLEVITVCRICHMREHKQL